MSLKKGYFTILFFLCSISLIVLYSCKGKSEFSADVLKNGKFDTWTQGDNVAPDGWALGGAASGNINKETSVVKTGKNSAKVAMTSGDALALYQDVDNFSAYRNKEVVFNCWVNASAPGSAVLALHDGVKWVNSTPNSGSGKWELLVVKDRISGEATQIRAHLWVKNNATTYFDGSSLKTVD